MTDFLDSDALYTSIIEILAVTVLVDCEEKDRELIEFTHAGMVHNQILRPGNIITRTKLLDWFKANRIRIKTALQADDADAYKIALLKKIQEPTLQKRVLGSIFVIAVCDYDLHDEESDFIKKALAVWETELPTHAELDAVA